MEISTSSVDMCTTMKNTDQKLDKLSEQRKDSSILCQRNTINNSSLGHIQPLSLFALLISLSTGLGIHGSLFRCFFLVIAEEPPISNFQWWCPGSGWSPACMCKYHSANAAVILISLPSCVCRDNGTASLTSKYPKMGIGEEDEVAAKAAEDSDFEDS